MERRNAVRLIAGLAGVFGTQARGQRKLAEVTSGRSAPPDPKAEADYQTCLTRQDVATRWRGCA
jgi:hypothetical protein